jgi:Sulfotransferase family
MGGSILPAGRTVVRRTGVWHPEEMQAPPMVRRVLHQLPPLWQSVLLHARGDFAPWEDGFDFTPPKLATGESVGPPDFVGVGVQKAGTSWWYELILEHPGVYERPSIHKERHYLSRFCVEPFGPAEVTAYQGWFPRVEGTITGEWTPDYFAYPWVPPLLAEAAPDAKILVLLRDPIERYRSGLTFRLRGGAPHTSATAAEAIQQGFYARHLRRLLEFFPAEQVLVQQYEQCRAEPSAQLALTYSFLGLDAFEPEEIRREVNVSDVEKVVLEPEAEDRLRDLYRGDTLDLAALVPSLDMDLWPWVYGGVTS